jgi:HPt (histidine-containing phosphotransfer) domain-containing protein
MIRLGWSDVLRLAPPVTTGHHPGVRNAEPVLDPAILERLRALADTSSVPGEDILSELVRLFERDSEARLLQLTALWRAGAAREVARCAHTLKGSASQLGAVRVVAVAADIEAAAAADVDTAQLARLRSEVSAATGALRAFASSARSHLRA